jgi:hypothetical protein
MAAAYLVTLPLKGGMTLKGGNDSVIVWAEDATQAKSLASAAMSNDVPAAAWTAATATALVVGTELEGWTFTINLVDPVTPFTELSVSITAVSTDDIDDVGGDLAAALVTAGIAGAAYDSGTNVLTIVETTDGRGDWAIEAYATPPSAAYSTSLIGFGDTGARVTGFFGAITAAGAAGIARTSTLVAALPALYALCKVDR